LALNGGSLGRAIMLAAYLGWQSLLLAAMGIGWVSTILSKYGRACIMRVDGVVMVAVGVMSSRRNHRLFQYF
jgi:hypothetical protein